MTNPSPSIALARLRDGSWTDEEFRTWLRDAGAPLMERRDSTSDTVELTFVYDATADPHAPQYPDRVRLSSAVDRAITAERDLQRVGDSDWWTLTLTLPTAARFTYGFGIHHADDPVYDADDPYRRSAHQGDPRLAQAVAELPGAEPLPWLERAHRLTAEPTVDELTFHSPTLGNTRRVWVSVPPQWSPAGERYPFVVMFDGTEHHAAPRLRDALCAAGAIRDCVVVLVDPLELRNTELTANPDFSRSVATELLDTLRDRYHLSARPEDAAVSGSSFGGLCAGYTALHHPETFGVALMQSPSCWYAPHDDVDADLRGTEPVPALIQEFLDADQDVLDRLRLYQDCGIWEFGPPPARVWQVLGNRWLHQVLTLRGADTVYREFAGGHDAAWWRGTWAEALIWAFPSGSSTS